MKKILMTAAIALSCFAVKAQSDNVTIPVTINIPDIIVMSQVNTGMTGNTSFLNANDFNWGEMVGGWGFFQFKVSSNRHFAVNTTIGSFSFSPATGVGYDPTIDVNTGMNQSDFSWRLVETIDGTGAINPPAGAIHSSHAWNIFNSSGTPNVMDDCPPLGAADHESVDDFSSSIYSP
jgi:hypothetical protein